MLTVLTVQMVVGIVSAIGHSCPEYSLSKKLFIRTYGCQMNIYDSDRMADVLAPYGYASVDAPEEADQLQDYLRANGVAHVIDAVLLP